MKLANPRNVAEAGRHLFVTVTVEERKLFRKRRYDAVLVRGSDMRWRMTHNGRVVPSTLVETLRITRANAPIVHMHKDDLRSMARAIRNGHASAVAKQLEEMTCAR